MFTGADDVNEGDCAFRVLFKKPGYNSERGEYYAANLYELMKWLKITEDVSFDTCEFLYVHLILEDGNVQEVVCHDKTAANASSNVVAIRPRARPYVPEDAQVIKEVSDLLIRAGKEKEVKPKKARPGKVRTAFGVYAYPARSGDYNDED